MADLRIGNQPVPGVTVFKIDGAKVGEAHRDAHGNGR